MFDATPKLIWAINDLLKLATLRWVSYLSELAQTCTCCLILSVVLAAR